MHKRAGEDSSIVEHDFDKLLCNSPTKINICQRRYDVLIEPKDSMLEINHRFRILAPLYSGLALWCVLEIPLP